MSSGSDVKRVTVFLTGFGPFGAITINPSSQIARHVIRRLELLQRHQRAEEERDCAPDMILSDIEYKELETSVTAVTAYFDDLRGRIKQILSEDATARVLLLHFGVQSKETKGIMRVEARAYNELDFHIPDVRNATYTHEPIDKNCGRTTTYLESYFARPNSSQLTELTEIVNQLNVITGREDIDDPEDSFDEQRKEFIEHRFLNLVTKPARHTNDPALRAPVSMAPQWQLSHDAGRYLCNYTFYRALQVQSDHPGRVAGIFIHVVDPTKGQTNGAAGFDEADTTRITLYNPTATQQAYTAAELVLYLLNML